MILLSYSTNYKRKKLFFLLMTVFSKSFLTLVRSHLMSFSFFSAWHNFIYYLLNNQFKNVFKKNTPATNRSAKIKFLLYKIL
jgi:hypothetical protein